MKRGRKDGEDLRRPKKTNTKTKQRTRLLVKGSFAVFESLSVQAERFAAVRVRLMFKMAFFLRSLTTDEVVQILIIKANGGGVLGLSGIDDARNFSPMNGSETHRTRKAGSIKNAVVKGKTTEMRAGITDGDNFSVGGGVVGL